ncbi:uncharacterized protein LOC121290944 isoform X2 [Carcharodon carcharias]|uniref:uncharacterized protein LOC121290944 isoform X2 n=1 Tax=Carcharodon carcharias TaxID=13397 RepID=UPI001B7E460C|nr:uncharacterized protein LOC121290944 isoform X2 [Carcharodon carcharias]
MNAFKLSSIWQENFSKLFSSNKSVEEDNPTKNTSETESPKDNQTAVSPKDGKIDEQTPPRSATKLFTDLAKVSQGSVDQEKSSAQEKPTASEPISAFPLSSLNQPEDGMRQKLGSFFSRVPKSKPDQPLTLSQSERVNSPDLNAENQDGAQVSNWNDDAEKEPHRKHITPFDSDAGENGRGTLETSYPESPAAEQIFTPAESLEQNKPEIAHPKAIGINSSTSGQYKGSGRSEEKHIGSACVTDPTGLQKLRIFSASISLEEDVGALRSDKDAVYQKTLMKLQSVVGECKEINSQALEDRANEADSSENEQNMPVPPTITYSTYRGARRIKRRRSLRKTFQPVNPTISEVDEKIVVSLVDQPLLNQLKEETNHCVLLRAPAMTKIQTPLEEKIPLINNGKGNAELQPRICTATFPSSKPGLVKDVKTENEPLKQQSSFSGVSGEIELTGPHHRETAKVGSECSTVTTGTIGSTKKQVSVSNTISVQKITAVNPDGTPFPGLTMTLEDSHSKGGGVLEKDAQCFVQKDNLIADHNDQSHKDEDNADITTSKLTPQTEGSSKTTIMMKPQQKLHVPPASKTTSKKGNETDVPKMLCSTVDADEAATAQNLKLVSLNNPTSLTENNQQADNTDRQQRSIVANLEDQALTNPVVIASKQDDMEKEIEKTESVSKNEKQGPMLEILDNATVPTKVVSLIDPVKAIHLSNKLDAPKVILDKYDVQLEIASRTQTNGHITESGTFAVFNNKGDIPDASTNDMPKKYKDKDNVTGLSTESLTTDTGYAIERPPKEYHQTLQRKSVPDIIHVNEESSSQVLKKQMSMNSSTLTTVEVINKTINEDTVNSANVTNESTGTIESDKHPKIPSATFSKIATDTAPSAMQSFGISNSESTITTEFQEITEASNLETENSLYIQKPDQLFKISSEKEHDHSSDSLPGTLACLPEPKVSKAVKPSLPNESIFYRYYQESTYFLLDSDKNAHSIANSEIATVPAVKQNQSFEEVQDNKKASNFVAMPKDASESSMETSKCSLSENSLWYRCFQQSTGLLNKRESTQPNTSNETNLGNTQTDENVQLTKPIALVANFTKEAIQNTLQGDALNNSRMTCSSEQNEESEKKTKSYDNKDSDATISGQPEGEETALKTKEKKELITLQSRPQLIKEICVVDASQAHPVERVITTDSNNILEGKTKEVEEEIIFSARQGTPHTQMSTTVIKEDVTNTQTNSDITKTARLVDTEDAGLNESTKNVIMNNTIEEEHEELAKTVQVTDEGLKGMVHPGVPVESENNSIYIAGGKSQDSPLVTHGNVAEYVPSIHRADEKATSFFGVIESDNENLQMEPHEKRISSAPFLPVDADLTPVYAVNDVTNQEAGAGLLNLTSTSQAIGNTESALKTIEVKVNDVQVRAQDPVEETEQRTELMNIVIAAEDSLSETPSEIMKTDNNSDHMVQECSAIVMEQCSIIDPTQSTAALKTDSITSAHAQENFMSDFGQSLKTSEASNFQSGSVQLKISLSGLSTDQGDSTNQTTKSEEDGTCVISETPRSSNISLSDSVKPVNGVAKRMVQKIMLSSLEAITNIQVPDGAQLSSSDTEPATKSNMTLPSASKSAVGLVAFTEPVTPHTQSGSTVSLEDVTTAETASNIIKTDRLMDRPREVGLIASANNLPMNSSIEEELELVKTVEVNGERVKELMNSEIPEESENTSKYIAEGKSQDSPLVTHGNVAEYVPSIHRADEKATSFIGVIESDNENLQMEPHEKRISSAPFLPVDTDVTPVYTVNDITNQEAGAGLLNLTSTSQAIGNTESALKTIEVKVNDVQVRAQDPVEETEQRTELMNIEIAAEDSLSETPSEIMKTDNNSDHMAQECSAIVIEQCNIIDPTQSTAALKTDSITSAHAQENFMSDFGQSLKTSEASNFQSGSVQLKISLSGLSTDQGDYTNQTTKSEEDGTCVISETPRSSNISLSDSVKPVNGVAKRMMQKIMLSSLEAITNIQVPDGAQMSSSDTESATKSNMTLPSASKSAVGLVAFTEPVKPHTQSGSTVSLEDVTTAETASNIIKTDRLMDRPREVGLIDSTNNLPMNNTVEEELEELVKTVEVNGERVKEVVHSEIPEESENTLIYIAGGKSQDSPLVTHGNLATYVPSIHRADEKDVSITMEPHEESRSSAPFLPVDTDLTPVYAVKDVISQEAGSGLLNPTSTIQATGNTESALETIEVKVNDVQVKAQDLAKETEQRTELRNIVIAAEDSLSETPSEIMKTDNNSDHMVQECSAIVIEQCNIIDLTQSTAALKTDSINSAQSNDAQEKLIAAFEISKSSQLTDPGDFTNVSMKNAEENETGRIAEPQATFDILFAHSANSLNDHVTKSIETIEHHLNMEDEMEPQFLEQEALILDTSLSHNFNRRQIYPFALPPIYEEQELENDATMDTYSITHSPTSTTEYNSNQLVASIIEPAAASLHLMQTEHIFQEIEEEENPTSHVPALEASTSLSSDHLDKATLISQEINEKQNLPSQLQTETCVVDSKASPKPSAAEDSVFYRYFQSSRHYLSKVEKALPESAPKILTHLQQKPADDSNLLKCSPDSKCLVKNKNLKINPRPGKVVIYDQLNFLGNKREIFTDVSDATSWNFFEGISLKVVRGCWMLCEKPDFQGQTYVLEEGYRELDELWVDKSLRMEFNPTKIVIGSIKRIGKSHCIPEIAIFQEPQQDDIKTYLHSEVTCIEECGISPSVSSIIVNSGIWLAYYQANFSGRCTLLETDNSPVPLTAEVKSDNIKSLRPLEMGGLKVERPMAPQVIVFEKTFFNGRFKEICEDASDLKNLWEDVTDLNINGFRGVGSVRVIGGLWVCYEKECYRGHQYLLEEGEYEDWQAWGGFNSTVQSMRYIQADHMKPEITLFEEADLKKGNNIFVIHAIPNLESIGYGTVTRSIEVKNGAWVAYRQEHYSGEQYILEKGVYRNYHGWGGEDSSIMSIRPIQLLQAYNGINFQGESVEFVTEIPSLPSLQPNSFKVLHGRWVLYDEKDYSGCQYVLEEGQYPDLDSLGCLSAKPIQSLKPIRNDFSMPSISLFSLYSFEGLELNLTGGTSCWKDKDYYNIPKSIKVKGGIWIAYEHANFRGNQLLLECTEIANWNKFSGWETIGSVHPLKQPRVYFRIKNKATGGFMTAVGDSKDPRESKLFVCPYNGKTIQMWFYCNGLIKSKANSACIDAISGQEKAGAKVTLWTEHGRTHQKWNINRDGSISSFLDSNLRLDIKGGDFYDKDHIILNFPGEPQQTQFWDIEVMI